MVEKSGTITVALGDTHIGSDVALGLPEWVITGATPEEDKKYFASIVTKWLHQNWVNAWDYIKTLAGIRGKYRKHRIVTLVSGDIVEGQHHLNNQCLSNPADQISLASEIFTQVANLSDGGVFAARGTPTHAGATYEYERQVIKNCGFLQYENELHLDIDGLIVWLYHHGRAGARPWSSSAASVAIESRLYAQSIGQQPPDYVFTGHHHRIDDSGIKSPTRAITLPSWQLRTTYGNKVASNSLNDIGLIIVRPDRSLDTTWARCESAPTIPPLRKI
jgi:translation initiation factor IF-1